MAKFDDTYIRMWALEQSFRVNEKYSINDIRKIIEEARLIYEYATGKKIHRWVNKTVVS